MNKKRKLEEIGVVEGPATEKEKEEKEEKEEEASEDVEEARLNKLWDEAVAIGSFGLEYKSQAVVIDVATKKIVGLYNDLNDYEEKWLKTWIACDLDKEGKVRTDHFPLPVRRIAAEKDENDESEDDDDDEEYQFETTDSGVYKKRLQNMASILMSMWTDAPTVILVEIASYIMLPLTPFRLRLSTAEATDYNIIDACTPAFYDWRELPSSWDDAGIDDTQAYCCTIDDCEGDEKRQAQQARSVFTIQLLEKFVLDPKADGLSLEIKDNHGLCQRYHLGTHRDPYNRISTPLRPFVPELHLQRLSIAQTDLCHDAVSSYDDKPFAGEMLLKRLVSKKHRYQLLAVSMFLPGLRHMDPSCIAKVTGLHGPAEDNPSSSEDDDGGDSSDNSVEKTAKKPVRLSYASLRNLVMNKSSSDDDGNDDSEHFGRTNH